PDVVQRRPQGMRLTGLLSRTSRLVLAGMLMGAPLMAVPALAHDQLVEPAKDPANWVMTGRDYNAQNYSTMTQINKETVKRLRPAWSFSTGVLHGHEGTPLVVGDKMFIHSPFPNTTFALDLKDPGRIIWQNKPKQNPTARTVAC